MSQTSAEGIFPGAGRSGLNTAFSLFYAQFQPFPPKLLTMLRRFSHFGLLAISFAALHAASATCVPPRDLSQSPPTAENLTDLGSWFSDHDQYDCALNAYRSALKLQPESSRTYYLLGLNFLRSGSIQSAVEPLQKSIQLESGSLKPHLLLANTYEELRGADQARKEWVASLQIDPHSTIALHGLSRNLLASGDYVSVIQLLGSSAQEEELTIDLAQAYDAAGLDDRATEVLMKAVQSKPQSLELTSALITILVKQSRFEQAAALAKKSMQLHPKDRSPKKLYLHVLVLNDDQEIARPLSKKLLAAMPHDFEVLYLNGVIERESGEYAAARAHLQEAAKLDPSSFNCHYNLGVTLAKLKEPKAARQEFEKAIELGASEPQVYFEFASVLRSLGETQKATEQLKYYQEAERAKENRTLAAMKLAQADKELASGDPHQAVALYREAESAVPQNPMIDYKLGMALDRIGETDAERGALENAIKLNPRMATAHHQLGYLASQTGDMAAAEEQFREATSAAPGYFEAWISLAATLGMESKFPEAQKALDNALQLEPQNAQALQLRKDLTAAASKGAP